MDECVEKLNELGFVWSRKKSEYANIENLTAYKRQHGHCSVSGASARDPKLARWVGKKRAEYKRKQDDSSSTDGTKRSKRALRNGLAVGFCSNSTTSSVFYSKSGTSTDTMIVKQSGSRLA